jgi:alpha-amylase
VIAAALLLAEPVIYMAMTDRFADGDKSNDAGCDRKNPGAYHGGDFRGLREKMPYLAELGVDFVWISPILDNVEQPTHGKGFDHYAMHGYWTKDFERLEEHFGDEKELLAMVSAAHAQKIGVLIDVVLNHAGYGSPWEARADWTRSPKRGDCGPAEDDATQCLHGLPDFRTEKPEVAEYLVRTQLGWAKKSGCDGFRVDAVKHMDHGILRRLRDAAPKGFRLLGEVWGTRATTEYGDRWPEMDWLFDFEFADEAFKFVTGISDAKRLDEYLKERAPRAAKYVHYLDTHDVPGFFARVGGDKAAMKLAAALELSIPGVPLVYYGDEVARPTGDWPANRSDMPWDGAQDKEMLAHYKKWIAARKRMSGPVETLEADGQRYAFRRGKVTVILNAGDKPWRGVAARTAEVN